MAVTGEKEDEVTLRIHTWWGIVICFSLGDFRSTLDDVDVFALISFLALKNIVRLYLYIFRGGYIGLFLLTICLSVLIALSCIYYLYLWLGF